MAAPCARKGSIGWAASPRRTARPSVHLSSGARSKSAHLNNWSGWTVFRMADIEGCQFSKSLRSSAGSPAIAQPSSVQSSRSTTPTKLTSSPRRKRYVTAWRPRPIHAQAVGFGISAPRAAAGTTARHATLPVKRGRSAPSICSRRVDLMPSAPIRMSPENSRPSFKRSATPLFVWW